MISTMGIGLDFGVKVAKEEVKVLVNVSSCETETSSSSILGKF